MLAIRFFLLLFLATTLHAAELTIGATLPLSGRQQQRGQMVQDGLAVALKAAAGASAASRPRIRLDILDDKGDPALAAGNAEKLITAGKAQALVGCVGGAVCAAVEAVARRYQVPVIGAIHASDEVCKEKSLAFCLHAAFTDEAAAIARQLETLRLRVARLWISEEFAAHESGVAAALASRNLEVAVVRADRTADALKAAVTGPDRPGEAHVLFMNNADAVALTRALRQGRPNAIVGVLSTVEPVSWLQKTQGLSAGILVAHSLPNPDIPKSRLAKAYQKAIADFSEFNLPYEFAQLEAFLAGRLLDHLARQGVADKFALSRALNQNEYRIEDFELVFPNGRRTLAVPVGLSVVGRNGVLLE